MNTLICKKCHRIGVEDFLKREADAWNRKTAEQTTCMCGENFDNVIERGKVLKLWMGSDYDTDYTPEFGNILIDMVGSIEHFKTEEEMRTILKYRWLETFDEVPDNLEDLATGVFIVNEEIFK